MDGYLGWAFRCRMAENGHDVSGLDNFSRRNAVEEVGSDSGLPIRDINIDEIIFHDLCRQSPDLPEMLAYFKPDVILHLAENPSAPYSMMNCDHAISVQYNNVIGTLNLLYAIHEVCPEAHLIKLGTMGEYGTPNIDITEGDIEITQNGRSDMLPFPCQPLSFYHASKVHDSVNIRLACQIWGLRCTDIMQGVVYGTSTKDTRKLGHTRFDFDEYFGTVINRFCAQAIINHPLTVYGGGNHKRPLLPLDDSMQCLDIVSNNPPKKGEYRVINQFEQYLSMNSLAMLVLENARKIGSLSEIVHIENPRIEKDEHYYNPIREKLIDMGYKPTMQMNAVVQGMFEDLIPYRDRILAHKDSIMPKTRWVA